MITQKMRKDALFCISESIGSLIAFKDNAHIHGQVQGNAQMAYRCGLIGWEECKGIYDLANRLYGRGWC